MVYAQIKEGLVKNTIIIDDESLVPLFTVGVDQCLRIDDVEPQPGKGWSYIDNTFIPPIVVDE